MQFGSECLGRFQKQGRSMTKTRSIALKRQVLPTRKTAADDYPERAVCKHDEDPAFEELTSKCGCSPTAADIRAWARFNDDDYRPTFLETLLFLGAFDGLGVEVTSR